LRTGSYIILKCETDNAVDIGMIHVHRPWNSGGNCSIIFSSGVQAMLLARPLFMPMHKQIVGVDAGHYIKAYIKV